MNTKNVSLVAVGVILVAAVVVSFLVSRPGVFVKQTSMPVFMGQEVVVPRVVEVTPAIRVEKAVRAAKAVSQPVAQPKAVAPLPIMPPKISYRVLPQYPLTALQQGLAGTTVLSVYVGLTGAAEKVSVKASSGVAELDESAIAAVSQWQFSPAAQGGQAMASWFEIPVRFELN